MIKIPYYTHYYLLLALSPFLAIMKTAEGFASLIVQHVVGEKRRQDKHTHLFVCFRIEGVKRVEKKRKRRKAKRPINNCCWAQKIDSINITQHIYI